jgi:AraC-like DNA-binding protein
MRVGGGSLAEFDALREAYGGLFRFDTVDRADRRDFVYAGRFHNLGNLSLATIEVSSWVCERDESIMARRNSDRLCLAYFPDGRHRVNADGLAPELDAGDILVTSADRALWMASTGHSKCSLTIDRALVEPLVGDIEACHGQVLRAGTPMNGLVASHMTALTRQAGAFSASEVPLVARATAALIAAGLGPSADGREIAARGVSAAMLRKVRLAIDRDLADPALSPDVVARRCGMSRAALYRLAEPLGGVSRYIHERRLARAHREITDLVHSRERIGTIASRWGFDDLAVFSRAFRARYGRTPSEARHEALGGATDRSDSRPS